MQKNQLGKSDLFISQLTLGCMSLGTDKKQAQTIIDQALDAGINHLDTADLYDFGLNEEIVGQAIKDKREQVIITSKVGNHFDRDAKDWFWDPSKAHIIEGLKDSLQRLKTDYIDFYMLHGGTIDDPINESIEAFEELKKDGLIRAYGISSIRPNVIREYVKRSSIDAVMMQYSMLDRRPEEEILDLLQQNTISVLARGPLAKGILSDNGEKQIERKSREGYLDYTYEELVKVYDEIKDVIGDSASFNTAALQYVLHHPAVASAVFGASSVEQLRENTAISQAAPLPEEKYQALQAVTKPMQYTNHR
ncbi:aldo/keto reductase [Virgibacillus dakarensis]|uniref:aldo/keto reductase n=1 Tax=Virgibacillus dakarensis TaxID=1917889 RepID=UPI000B4431B1|nr:aldo/keto reductase [Virgibacillus dakarensis]MBT2214337.1 aldo/keto reductase [Virgibacillus dakarensis]MTW85014.1 aldo/keto reductase [Virgibacillus dakarensis]